MKTTNKYTKNIRMPELENCCIIMVKKEYRKTTSGKSWKRNPYSMETRKITAENYWNYCDSITFFRNLGGSETCDFGYTYAGYLVIEIRSTNPDRTRKIVRRFYIVDNEKTAHNIYHLEW